MTYQTIQPPFTLVFHEMSKKELRDYRQWFLGAIPERIKILSEAVKSTSGFENWEPDTTPESLEPLGEWFFAQVETRRRTKAEIDSVFAGSSFGIEVPDWELSNKTFSLAIDIGMYLGQVLVRNQFPGIPLASAS
jgi:hypothetical protein